MSFHKARYICIRNLLLSKTHFRKLVSESAIRKPEYSTPELLVLSYSFLANFSAWSYFIEVCIFHLLLRFYEICTKDCWITAIQIVVSWLAANEDQKNLWGPWDLEGIRTFVAKWDMSRIRTFWYYFDSDLTQTNAIWHLVKKMVTGASGPQ